MDIQDIEGFLSVLSMIDNETIYSIYHKQTIRELLRDIDLEKDMQTLYDYVNTFHVGDKVSIISTGQTGAILSISKDEKFFNVVVDEFDDMSDQVVTVEKDDLEKRA